MTNTTSLQDRMIAEAQEFAERNDCASKFITELMSIIEDLDTQLSEAKHDDSGSER